MTLKECNVLRGIAITGIFLHNYCHLLPYSAAENEFSFSAANNAAFWTMLHGDRIVIQFFSFWGHLGVPLFVFLSGYGLVMKYDKKESVSWKPFLLKHFKKLFIPMVLGTLLFLLVHFLMYKEVDYSLSHAAAQLTFLINLMPHPELHFSPGPYWYFGMTLQLYVFYRLLVYRRPNWIFVTISILLGIVPFFLQQQPHAVIWMKYNFAGWVLPFMMGILSARYQYEPSRFSWTACGGGLISLLIPFFGFHYHLWLLIPVIVTIAAICLMKLLPQVILKVFEVIGGISLYIFVLHPFIRELTLPLGEEVNPHLGVIVYALSTLLLAWLLPRARFFQKTRI